MSDERSAALRRAMCHAISAMNREAVQTFGVRRAKQQLGAALDRDRIQHGGPDHRARHAGEQRSFEP